MHLVMRHTSYELNVFLFVVFSNKSLSKLRIPRISCFFSGLNALTCKSSMLYSRITSSSTASNLLRTSIHVVSSDFAHLQVSIEPSSCGSLSTGASSISLASEDIAGCC